VIVQVYGIGNEIKRIPLSNQKPHFFCVTSANQFDWVSANPLESIPLIPFGEKMSGQFFLIMFEP
jgi:hypothetical protein